MGEQVFFVINGQELILDKVLVEFDDTPILFVCKSNNFFVSACVDLEDERYIVTKVSLSRLSKMLHGKITMRELIVQTNKYWDIIPGEDTEQDIVVEKNINEIPLNTLPYEGAYFKVATRDLAEYVEKVDMIFYSEDGWNNEIMQENVDYFGEVARSLDNQYEGYQHIYERVISDMKILASSRFHEGDYSNKICSSEVETNKMVAIRIDIKILNQNGVTNAV